MKNRVYILLILVLIVAFSATAKNNPFGHNPLKEYPKENNIIPGNILMGPSSGMTNGFEFSANGVNQGNINLLNIPGTKTTFKNTVELLFNNHTKFEGEANVKVKAIVTYYPIDGGTAIIKDPVLLEVDYKSGALKKSSISNIFAFTNAYKVVVKITSVEVTPNDAILKEKLINFVEINIGFQKELITGIGQSTTVNLLAPCPDTKTDELVISWSSVEDAEEYELEYTYVDDYSDNYSHLLTEDEISYNFKDNSTRIALKDTYYRLPLLFERGYILYRVRAVGRNKDNLQLPQYCEWSGNASGDKIRNFTNKYYHADAHVEDKINWQATSTFAEDGKRSDMLNYLDGTFRSRQTVTGMNLEKSEFQIQPETDVSLCFPGSEKYREIIAGETVYDYQGRAGVNILPAPTNSLKIVYLKKLNKNESGIDAYSWRDFDKATYLCADTKQLSSVINTTDHIMGSSAYYSSNNPNKLGFNAFIPEAVGYSFTQQNYLQDNTGKVAVQSGVGETFKFGNNHETKFFYAAPQQEELDRMFGIEVGDALCYQKNAVMDANGQVSVTYINPSGKTIATCLAGNTPTYPGTNTNIVDPLENQNENTISISLLNKNILNNEDKTLVTEHQFFVSTRKEYTFDYHITPETIDTITCANTKICLDCIYDIDITLNNTQSCTIDPVYHFSGHIGELLGGNNKPDIINCNNNSNTGDYDRHFPLTDKRMLDIGTYTITKKITVNRQAALSYVDEAFKEICGDKWKEIERDEFSRIDTMDCYSSCLDCDQPPVQTTVCDTAYCEPNPNRCDVIRGMLRSDISPGGQYAQFTRNSSTGTLDVCTDLLSIFNPNNVLPYRSTHPEANYIFTLLPAASQITITNYTTLVDNWLPEYAELFLPLHPEYCMLSWCDNTIIKNTLDFDVKILSVDKYSDALQKGYVPDPNVPPTKRAFEVLMEQDDWTTTGPTLLIDELRVSLLEYGCTNGQKKPIDELAMHSAMCVKLHPPVTPDQHIPGYYVLDPLPAINNSTSSQTCPYPSFDGSRVFGSPVTSDSDPNLLPDLEWKFLRSFYLSAKEKVLRKSMIGTSPCFISCIDSDPSFWNSLWGPYQNIPWIPPAWFDDAVPLPCSTHENTELYAEKKSRFGNGLHSVVDALNDLNNSDVPLNTAYVNANINNLSEMDNACNISQTLSNNASIINHNYASNICDTLTALPSPVLPPPTYNTTVKDYLNAVLRIINTNGNNPPSSAQLMNLLPTALKQKKGMTAFKVELETKPDFAITVFYYNIKDSSRALTSGIVLKTNKDFGDWAKVKKIVSLSPDNKGNRNGITKSFTAKMLTVKDKDDYINDKKLNRIVNDSAKTKDQIWRNTNIVDVKGNTTDLNMNVYADVNFCDSIRMLPGHPYVNACVDSKIALANTNTAIRYYAWVDSMKADLLEKYYAKCLKAVETFTMTYNDLQYHYTLYYYDQANNLVKTIPPAGVRLLNSIEVEQVKVSRANNYNSPVPINHVKPTLYSYNTLNEVRWQKTPDAGESNFYYDELGRIVASQNEEQAQNQGRSYSYTRYDKQGRIEESGKITPGANISDEHARNFTEWKTFIDSQTDRTEITITKYDASYLPEISLKFGTEGQQNLRKRVASVLSFDNTSNLNLTTPKYTHATHYTYDVAGNVPKLIQDYPNGIIGDKIIDYDFDLQSGKVNEMVYQRGKLDQFMHRYSYDAANRLIRTKTSLDGLTWETDAEYFYYRHGTLARLELGTDKVQGLDYLYTLQGFIKGVNGVTISHETDMGQDGILNTTSQGEGYGVIHNPVARDAFGFVLDYFDKNYMPISMNSNVCLAGLQTSILKPLFNGNISRMYTQIQKPLDAVNPENVEMGNRGFDYTYDQLNRIKSQSGWKLYGGSMLPIGDDYKMQLSYDADGNILSLQRNIGNGSPLQMDNLNYNYISGTNKLEYISDTYGSNSQLGDIETQSTNNYNYNLIGNLTSDESGQLNRLDWNIQNKVTKISKVDGTIIVFGYDAIGNRILKDVNGNSTSEKNLKTFYLRDGKGNILSTYTYKNPSPGETAPKLHWDETDIYGSSRIGLYKPDKEIPNTGSGTNETYSTVNRGYKFYELSNHLGNVLATVTDKKLPHFENNSIDYFTADISSAQDYYPFGMEMPGRKFNSSVYGLGFNGKLNDNEVYGESNFQDYGFRMYDTRVCRFLSVDPLTRKYPELTPYQFASNSPIKNIDLDGLEGSSRIIESSFSVSSGIIGLKGKIFGFPIDMWIALPNATKTTMAATVTVTSGGNITPNSPISITEFAPGSFGLSVGNMGWNYAPSKTTKWNSDGSVESDGEFKNNPNITLGPLSMEFSKKDSELEFSLYEFEVGLGVIGLSIKESVKAPYENEEPVNTPAKEKKKSTEENNIPQKINKNTTKSCIKEEKQAVPRRTPTLKYKKIGK